MSSRRRACPSSWSRASDAEAAAQLLAASAPEAADPVREWLLAEAAGNPLALLELPSGLSAAQLQGRAALPETAPLTSRLRSAFVQRIDRLPAETRTALLIAAVDDSGEVAAVVGAAGEAGLPADALDSAERVGLLRVVDGRIVFRHPLVRSALLESATHSQRRGAHAALAAALSGDEHADRRAWHRALAALAADEEVAAALEASARRYQARAGHASAATAFVRAAELSADEGGRTGRLAAAAEAAWAAGQPERARELITRALPLTTGQPRAELLYLRGVIEARTGDLRGAVAVLVEAADASEDGSLTLELLTEATEAAEYAGDYAQAAAIGARADAIEPRSETDRFRVAALSGVAAELAGDHERAEPLLREAIRRAEQLEDPRPLVWASLMATMGSMAPARRRAAVLHPRRHDRATTGAAQHPSDGAVGAGERADRPRPLQARARRRGGGNQARERLRTPFGCELEPDRGRPARRAARRRVRGARPCRRGHGARRDQRRDVDRRLRRVGARDARVDAGKAGRGDRPPAARDRRRSGPSRIR